MAGKFNVLVLGASYGSLLGTKLGLAGHHTHLVCLPAEAELINSEGAVVRMPVKGRDGLVEVNSQDAARESRPRADRRASIRGRTTSWRWRCRSRSTARPACASCSTPSPRSRVPCMSIMNMPPLALSGAHPRRRRRRLPRRATPTRRSGTASIRRCLTLCSPDPQAFRPPDDKVNVLQVRLPTNFKAARFDSDAHTAILRRLERGHRGRALRRPAASRIELPVKLKVHDSVFVPLAKWSMLIAGNYRCVQKDGMRSIKDAVHGDLEASRAVYDWVVELCVDARRRAEPTSCRSRSTRRRRSRSSRPSSAARALVRRRARTSSASTAWCRRSPRSGASAIAVLDETVALVDARLELNRKKAA